jgi:hypothetical protein
MSLVESQVLRPQIYLQIASHAESEDVKALFNDYPIQTWSMWIFDPLHIKQFLFLRRPAAALFLS